MLKTESVIDSLLRPSELNHRLTNKTLVLSSRQMDWNGILIEQYQNSLTPGEVELPALSNHWLKLPLGHPGLLTQKCDDRLYESTVSPHLYVIQQRVERAKLMLSKTDLAITLRDSFAYRRQLWNSPSAY